MDIHIISNIEQKMLKRKEITFKLSHEKDTPSRESIKKELCKKLSLMPEATFITTIEQKFGSRESVCIAHVYDKKEDMERLEQKHLLERIKKKSDKVAAKQAQDTASTQSEK